MPLKCETAELNIRYLKIMKQPSQYLSLWCVQFFEHILYLFAIQYLDMEKLISRENRNDFAVW